MPGIGFNAVRWLADQHKTRAGAKELADQGDVFTSIRINGKIWPLGTYIRKKLREELGVPQNAQDRANLFGKVYFPSPDEWASPLVDYCPHQDITTATTVRRRIEDAKAKAAELPEIQKKSDHKARRAKRRFSQTVRI